MIIYKFILHKIYYNSNRATSEKKKKNTYLKIGGECVHIYLYTQKENKYFFETFLARSVYNLIQKIKLNKTIYIYIYVFIF